MSQHQNFPGPAGDATEVHHVPGYWPPTPMVRGHRRTAAAEVLQVQTERSWPERILETVKNVVVIITCVIVVYSILKAYVAIENLRDALQATLAGFGN